MAGSVGAARSGENRVVLRDGSTIVIRPLVTGDVATITAWFEGLGPRARHARFLSGVTTLDDRTRAQLAQVDHRDHEAVAVTADGAVAGIARYVRLQHSSAAEVAVAVADRWGRRGIASLLLQQIVVRARAVGISSFTALYLASNIAAPRLLSRLGPMTATPRDAGVMEARISLGLTRSASFSQGGTR
ncbi:MAG: GNAT family N-acetyltransferase [Streptosporangiaceae bacterium]